MSAQTQSLEEQPLSGMTVTDSFNALFDLGDFKGQENARVFPAGYQLKGDFDSAARRIARFVPDITEVIDPRPIEIRSGRCLVHGHDIRSNWRILSARYNPLGSMNREEKTAFDTIIADVEAIEQYAAGAALAIVYSDKPIAHFDVNRFHIDFSSVLLRCYNHSPTLYALRDDVEMMPDDAGDVYFSLREGMGEQSFGLGNYVLYKGVDHPDAGEQLRNNGFIHRAPQKVQSGTPRIVLSAILANTVPIGTPAMP